MIEESKRPAGAAITERFKELAKLSIDKLPVLNTIFERTAALCVEQFRDYCSSPFTAFVNQVVTGESWDLLESLSDSVAVIFYCREWDARLVIGLERRFVFAILESMYGGEGNELPFETTRPYSSIETRLGRIVCEFAAKSLETAFGSICDISLVPERTETSLEFTTLGQSSMILIHAQILFQVLDQGGLMFVLIPQSSMNPIRQKLERERKPLPASQDPRWTNALNSRISSTEIAVEAVLDGKTLQLGDIMQLEAGKIIELSGTDQQVILEYENDRLFRGRLGQAKGYFTVTIESAIGGEAGHEAAGADPA